MDLNRSEYELSPTELDGICKSGVHANEKYKMAERQMSLSHLLFGSVASEYSQMANTTTYSHLLLVPFSAFGEYLSEVAQNCN